MRRILTCNFEKVLSSVVVTDNISTEDVEDVFLEVSVLVSQSICFFLSFAFFALQPLLGDILSLALISPSSSTFVFFLPLFLVSTGASG